MNAELASALIDLATKKEKGKGWHIFPLNLLDSKVLLCSKVKVLKKGQEKRHKRKDTRLRFFFESKIACVQQKKVDFILVQILLVSPCIKIKFLLCWPSHPKVDSISLFGAFSVNLCGFVRISYFGILTLFSVTTNKVEWLHCRR